VPRDVALSKTLALLLRHAPARFGVVLDKGGWAPVDAVVRGLRAAGWEVDAAVLARVADAPGKQRYVLQD
jgi:putative RNA 2'-phosphotransferase